MAREDKEKAAHWQDNPVAPKPVQHRTPLKIDLVDTGVEYEDGKILAITGTLSVVPHTPQQQGPLDIFFKDGPIVCNLLDNHKGNSLGVVFALRRMVSSRDVPYPPQAPIVTPSAEDPDSVAAEKVAKARTEEGFDEAVQFVMQRHSYPRGAAESVVAEFGVSDILNDKKIWSIEEKFKDSHPGEELTGPAQGAQPGNDAGVGDDKANLPKP